MKKIKQMDNDKIPQIIEFQSCHYYMTKKEQQVLVEIYDTIRIYYSRHYKRDLSLNKLRTLYIKMYNKDLAYRSLSLKIILLTQIKGLGIYMKYFMLKDKKRIRIWIEK